MDTGSINLSGDETFHLDSNRKLPEYYVERIENCITVDAVREALDPVMDMINEYLVRYESSPKVMSEIRLAVEEIFENICSYAYEPGRGKVRIMCSVVEDGSVISIRFSDTGIPFNPLSKEAPDTTGKQFEEREGGFGIHLVKSVMDEVSYEYQNGMNILKIKRLLK